MSEEKKVFHEEWKVDCNDCTRYWDNSCDGAKKDKSRPCNAFLATRSIILPEEIKRLKSQVKHNSICIIMLAVAIIIHSLSHLIG